MEDKRRRYQSVKDGWRMRSVGEGDCQRNLRARKATRCSLTSTTRLVGVAVIKVTAGAVIFAFYIHVVQRGCLADIYLEVSGQVDRW